MLFVPVTTHTRERKAGARPKSCGVILLEDALLFAHSILPQFFFMPSLPLEFHSSNHSLSLPYIMAVTRYWPTFLPNTLTTGDDADAMIDGDAYW